MHFLNDGSQSLSSVRRGVWDTNVARGILAIGLLLFSASCSAWKATDSDPLQLPSPRVSADSVSLEITFVRVPTGETNFNDELWGQVDEQCLDSEIRQGLNDNGFRVGLVGSQLPEVLRKVLDEQSQQNRLDQLVASEMDVLAQTRRIQNRGGQRNEIVAGPPQDELVVLYRAPGQSKVTGKPLHDAQCILAVRCFPQVSGGAKLEIVPEIHHGDARRQWVAGEGTFHFLSGREREVFEALQMETPLRPGQTLVLSSTTDAKGLGNDYFGVSGNGAAQQKILLIRLAQGGNDELFDRPPGKTIDEAISVGTHEPFPF